MTIQAPDDPRTQAIQRLEALKAEAGNVPIGTPVFTAPEKMTIGDRIKLLAKSRTKKGMAEGFAEGGVVGALPFVNILAPLAGNSDRRQLETDVDAVQAGTANQDQFDRVVNWSVERSRPGSALYVAAKVIKQSVAFGGELALTGGAFTAGKKGALMALGKLAGKEMLKETAEKGALSIFARTLGAGAGVATQQAAISGIKGGVSLATTGEWETPEDVEALRRALPEYEVDISDAGKLQLVMTKTREALGDKRHAARMSNFWEIATERMGPTLAAGLRKIPVARRVLILEEDLFKWMRGKKYVKTLDDLTAKLGQKAQIHGLVEEWMEERTADLLKAATPGMEEGFGDMLQTPEEALGEALGLAAPGTARALAGRATGVSQRGLEEKLGIVQDLTDPAPSPADQQIQEAGPQEGQEAETPARAPSAPLTQPGGTEAIVQEGLRSLSERAGEDVAEAANLSPEEAKVLEGLSRAAVREGRDVRVFDGPEGLDVQGQQAGEGVTLLNRKLLSDPTLAADVDFEEAWHDIGSKARETLDEAITFLQEVDPEGYAEAVEIDRAARPDLSDSIRGEEAVGTYAQGHRALVQYLQTEKGKAALKGFYEKDRTGFQKFVAAVRRLLSKLGLANTYEDKLLKRLSASIGYDVSVPEAKAADVLAQAFSAVQRRGWMPPSQRPTGPQMPVAELSVPQEVGGTEPAVFREKDTGQQPIGGGSEKVTLEGKRSDLQPQKAVQPGTFDEEGGLFEAEVAAKAKPKKKKAKKVGPRTLVEYVVALGGIDLRKETGQVTETWEALSRKWVGAKGLPSGMLYGPNSTAQKRGLSLDDMAEALAEVGFQSGEVGEPRPTFDEIREWLADEIAGHRPKYHPSEEGDAAVREMQRDDEDRWSQYDQTTFSIKRLAVEGTPAPKRRRKKGQRSGTRPILTKGESIRYAVAKAAAAEEKHLLPNAKAKIPGLDDRKSLDRVFRGWMSKRLHAQEWAKAQAAKNEQALIASIPGRSVGEVLKEAVSDEPSRRRVRMADQAMHLYIDLKGKAAEEYEKFSDSLTAHQRRIYKLSQNLSPEVQALANRIMAENDSRGDYLREAGVISSKVQHYSARYWEQEEGRGTPGSAKFKQTTGRAKHREYSSILQGWAEGRKLRIGGAIGSQLEARLETANVLHDRALIKVAIKAGVLSTSNQDGWLQVNHPNFWQKVEHVGKATAEEGEVSVDIHGKDVGATQEGDIFRYRVPLYAPEHLAKKLNNVLDRSWFADKKGWSWLAKWNAIIKANILFSSLFHHQAFLRSYMFGTPMHWGNISTVLNPIKGYRMGREAIDQWTPEVQELIDAGLTLQRDRDIDEAAMREKTRIGAIIDKIPGAKQAKNALVKLRNQQADFLFHRMGPHLKVMAALLEYRHLVIKHRKQLEAGTTTKADLAEIAASMANADFGGLNLDLEGRSQTMRQINRFFMLAPDWTESNVRTMLHSINPKGGIKGKAYRAMWARVAMRAVGATVLFNMLMAGMDDDDEDPDGKTFWTRYQRAWKEGNLRSLEVDITPLYRATGGKSPSRKYFSILGHFRDPIKFMLHWGRSGKHKVSVVGGTLLEAIEGSDWSGRPFTSWQEFIGIDDKGTYKTSRRGKDGEWVYRRGEPKGGKLKGETVSWRSTSGKGAIGWEELPSFAVNQGKGFMPIQVQNLTAWLMGEMDGFDALTKSAGLMTATTRPRSIEDRIDAIRKEMRDTDDQDKRRGMAEKIAALRKTRGTQ